MTIETSVEAKDYRVEVSTKISACRTGWRGAWDAIVAAWRKDRSTRVEEAVTFFLYVKTAADPADAKFHVEQGGEPLYMYGAGIYEVGGHDPGYLHTGVRTRVAEDGVGFVTEFKPPLAFNGWGVNSVEYGPPMDDAELEDWSDITPVNVFTPDDEALE